MHPLRRSSVRRRRGTSMLELVVVMAILIVAVSIFSQIVTNTSRVRATSHERSLAAEAARATLERMRNEDLARVFDLYNASTADDPDGPGTAPGHCFAVHGLDPQEGDPDGFVGEVFLPGVFLPEGESEGLVQLGLLGDGSDDAEVEPGTVSGKWMLREDADLPLLGMPRDLNGDGLIDGEDHRYDPEILPVCVKVSWRGRYGDRSLQLYTLLTDFEPGVIE